MFTLIKINIIQVWKYGLYEDTSDIHVICPCTRRAWRKILLLLLLIFYSKLTSTTSHFDLCVQNIQINISDSLIINMPMHTCKSFQNNSTKDQKEQQISVYHSKSKFSSERIFHLHLTWALALFIHTFMAAMFLQSHFYFRPDGHCECLSSGSIWQSFQWWLSQQQSPSAGRLAASRGRMSPDDRQPMRRSSWTHLRRTLNSKP